ncbi:uncharacterized protein [Clytia hemisphaerica]|uniref:uncharacterized protein n=1 Tax=Clytia hemisphaerica TaxID=252671 RepID=UPI0034D72841
MANHPIHGFNNERFKLVELLIESTRFLKRVYSGVNPDPELDPIIHQHESKRLTGLANDFKLLYDRNYSLMLSMYGEKETQKEFAVRDVIDSAPLSFKKVKVVPKLDRVECSMAVSYPYPQILVVSPVVDRAVCRVVTKSCKPKIESHMVESVQPYPKVSVISEVVKNFQVTIGKPKQEILSRVVESVEPYPNVVVVTEVSENVFHEIVRKVKPEILSHHMVVKEVQPRRVARIAEKLNVSMLNVSRNFKDTRTFDNETPLVSKRSKVHPIVSSPNLAVCLNVRNYKPKGKCKIQLKRFLVNNFYCKLFLRSFWMFFLLSDFQKVVIGYSRWTYVSLSGLINGLIPNVVLYLLTVMSTGYQFGQDTNILTVGSVTAARQ